MAKQRYFKVLHNAGAFIDDFHYAQDEIVPYNPSEREEAQGKPLWGQEVDQHGNEIGRKVNPNAIGDAQADTFVKAQTGNTATTPTIVPTEGLSEEQKAQVKEALAAAQDELNRYRTVAMIAGGAAAAVFLFYYLPRFESPIPRIYRRRKS